MSLRIKHLNADSSFLLIFSPPYANYDPQGTYPGSYTILVDPWLSGPTKIYSSRFALTRHTVPSCIDSLADLPDPDLVLVSQDKPDHCHKETLLQLPPSTSATILGASTAAKKIRSWKHFDPSKVHSLTRFDASHDETIRRIRIPSVSPGGAAGEVTIAHLASSRDIIGLHNAVCITYRPPSTVLSGKEGSYVNLPMTPPTTPPANPVTRLSSSSSSTIYPSPVGPNREKTISIVYSPHGLDYSLVQDYARKHLVAEAALPLTALFHSFDRVVNPWYLGGTVCAGSPSGLEIARNLLAEVWISAHDEAKIVSGLSVKSTKTTKFSIEDLERLLNGDEVTVTKRKQTRLIELDAGDEYFIPAR